MNEPVAWMDGQGNLYRYPDDADRGQTMRPLFFAQSPRPRKLLGPNLEEVLNSAGFYKKRGWVNLTDEEISAASKGHMTRNGFARVVETKLNEKNG